MSNENEYQQLSDKTCLLVLTPDFQSFRRYFYEHESEHPHLKLIENPFRSEHIFSNELYAVMERPTGFYITRVVCDHPTLRHRTHVISIQPAGLNGHWVDIDRSDETANEIFFKTKYFSNDEKCFPKIIKAIEAHPHYIEDLMDDEDTKKD